MGESVSRPIAWLSQRPLLLYGAGNLGRQAARNILRAGGQIAAFLDAAAQPGETRDSIPVYTLGDWAGRNEPSHFNVLLSVFNPQVDVLPILAELRRLRFQRIVTVVEYVNTFPEKEWRMWLGPSAFYNDKRAPLASARALLCDDISRSWFDGTVCLRIEGSYRDLPPHSQADQYMPSGLPRWPDPMRFIDCGAFDGDTLQAMRDAAYSFSAVAAFEPDPINFTKLYNRHRDLDAIFLPCGVDQTVRQLSFDAGLGASSRVDEQGTSIIQCVAIDEALPSFAPSLIKMDVEGAELAAMKGAEMTIRSHRPSLAICVYHKPADIWEIPLWIASLDLGYRMYLRGHGPNSIDLVLYCIA